MKEGRKWEHPKKTPDDELQKMPQTDRQRQRQRGRRERE